MPSLPPPADHDTCGTTKRKHKAQHTLRYRATHDTGTIFLSPHGMCAGASQTLVPRTKPKEFNANETGRAFPRDAFSGELGANVDF